jgi:polar amino acid transport system substrate-binding protein
MNRVTVSDGFSDSFSSKLTDFARLVSMPTWVLGCSLLGVLGASQPAQAEPGRANSVVELLAETFGSREVRDESVLDQVAATGKLVAGTRTDAAPFAYINAEGEWVGYSIDLLERIRSQLQQQLGRPVELELVAADGNGLTLVAEGEVDIVCGSTSFSRSRNLQVDFSLGYFVTGTQLLINADSELGDEFVIGSVSGTTNHLLIQKLFPIAQLVTVESRQVGLEALVLGRIDAFASDGILLEAMRQSWQAATAASGSGSGSGSGSVPSAAGQAEKSATAAPIVLPLSALEIVPNQPFDQESYACMLPQNNGAFQQVVNTSLLDFMQGALASRSSEAEVLNRWFGPAGIVPIDQQPLLTYFQEQVDKHSLPTPGLPQALTPINHQP